MTKLNDNAAAKSVEGVVDSSRYFVTQVQSQGRSAYVGFGFRDRDVALDLLGNLQQFQRSIQREQQAKDLQVAEIPKLAEGEKIHINFGNSAKNSSSSSSEKKTRAATNKSVTTGTGGSSSGSPFLLKKPPKAETTAAGTVNTNTEDVAAAAGNLQVQMGNINPQEDHKSVDSTDSENAHAAASVDDDLDAAGLGDDLDEEWDDFQQA